MKKTYPSRLTSDGVTPSRGSVEALLTDAIAPFVVKRRWFAAKDGSTPQFALTNLAPVEQGRFAFAELRAISGNANERYLLPLTYTDAALGADAGSAVIVQGSDNGTGAPTLVDATYTEDFVRASLELLRDAAILTSADDGEVRYLPTADAGNALIQASDNAHPFNVKWLSAEQSNSSVVVDERIVLKLLRRISAGTHPEAEMSRYLAQRGFRNSCGLLGEVVWINPDGEARTICIAQQFIANEGDAWKYATDLLVKIADESARPGKNASAALSEIVSELCKPYCDFAGLVGTRLAELHLALANETDEDAFRPEQTTADHVKSWISSASSQVAKALDVLGNAFSASSADYALAQSVIGERDRLLEAIAVSLTHSTRALCTRIHGDFHLGQILKTRSDVFIIDFEGEPSKPLEERRAKHSPIKDVAGLIRSLSYASASVLRSSIVSGGVPQRLETTMEACRRQAERAFISSYQMVLAGSSSPLVIDRDTFNALLYLFLLEKAAYEICYEAAHRPDWIGVPLGAFASLVTEQFVS
jgi:maltose alpha-D-glucosyltransferase/alpha-amylase